MSSALDQDWRRRKKIFARNDCGRYSNFFEFGHVGIADVEAELQLRESEGDFAGGVREYVGRSLARNVTTTFFSFDKNAVNRLAKRGLSAPLLQ